jgi:SAM-dependent methyltransferase
MERGEKERAIIVWGASPAGTAHADGAVPGTNEYFEKVRAKRNGYEIPWLLELFPFSSFLDKSVLELGCRAGYDAFEFCRNGSDYFGIDIVQENIEHVKKYLGLYGYAPRVFQGDAENLPFEDDTLEVIFVFGVLRHAPDIAKSSWEAHRAKKV